MPRALFPILLILVTLFSIPRSMPAAEHPPSFEADIRPILKAHCFHCHGEAGEREGGLDLRLRRLIASGGDSGSAIDLTNVDRSLLLQRVASGEMPPGDDKRLSTNEVNRIRAWLQAGAPTARPEPEEVGDGPIFTAEERAYWAFQPIQRPPVPQLGESSRISNPIDAFLWERMQQHREPEQPTLEFAKPVERHLLARRVWLDLTGLPPSRDELHEFLDDTAPDAFPRLVERLLASPHYGERWGRHWLDVAGYADSEGYTDEDRVREHAWRYRDYVIEAFNADLPFDEFVIEQLAGDELVAAGYRNLSPIDQRRLTATGFLRMAPDGTASGGIDQDLAKNQVMADTLQIVGTSLLGMTVHCAQCHDHRYDPIPTRDYYRLRAVFEPALNWKAWKTPAARQISLYTDEDRKLAADIEQQAKAIDAERAAKAEEYITRTLEEELLLVDEPQREPLRAAYRSKPAERSDDQQALLKEYPSVANISVGSLYLYDRRREERAGKLEQQTKQDEARLVAEVRQRELQRVPESDRAAVETAAKAATESLTEEQRKLLEQFPGVAVTAATLHKFEPESAARFEANRRQARELRESKAADDLKEYADKAAAVRATKPEEGFLRSLTETPDSVPETFVFYRGDHEQPRDAVTPGELSILPASAAIPDNNETLATTGRRLAFARSITDPDHPLLARVIVNRLWLHHFGRGLVNSPGDFGVLGERPTHPRLLDWLAREFIDSGWSVKHIHRLILGSSAYQQSAQPSEAALEFDPDNRLYTRFALRRLESEALRDVVLEISGQRNHRMYGKPVPVMEDEVGQIVIGIENLDGERKPTKAVPLNGDEFRRSVYVQVRRSRTLSLFDTFDAPVMTPNCERRSESTVALQSLMLMNSDFVFEFAQHMASRLEQDAGEDLLEQLRLGWELAYSQPPGPAELEQARQYVDNQSRVIRANDAAIEETAARSQALSLFCQALLGSNRFLYVE